MPNFRRYVGRHKKGVLPPKPPESFTLTVTVKDEFTSEVTQKSATFKVKELR